MADTSKGARHLVRTALAIALIAPLLVLAGAIATRAGWVDWKTGFGVWTVDWAPKAAMVGLGAGVLAVLFAFAAPKRLLPLAVVAVLIPGLTLLGFQRFRAKAESLPPIHDVSTDWAEPLSFSDTMMKARAGAANPVEPDPVVGLMKRPAFKKWEGRRIAEINAETCPGARPVPRLVEPEEVARVLEKNGVQVIGQAPWRVEGTHESLWYGFKDDVIVRMRPGRTDVRSVSRVGGSDLGANCGRVTKIVQALSGK
ncbi:MAG TPA: DUF1499 domain-containing protein [Caulobacteraceae bacterium]|nr:DUF1499 domain-containing protein [Caulobacteraceae bacterium]